MTDEMETISISHFKATCLAVLERIRRTGRPVLVTRRGQPIAEVVPPPIGMVRSGWMGSLQGRARIVGDIVRPAGDDRDWEALKP